MKLAAIGCEIRPLAGPDAASVVFSTEDVELMARMEHDRWLREREAAGWTYGTEKDIHRKRSRFLVPWSELLDDAKEQDRNAVRGMPTFLARAGFGIVRAGSDGEDG
ncbi:MAG: RyR domain-containing protein [Actinomycetota bacterium]